MPNSPHRLFLMEACCEGERQRSNTRGKKITMNRTMPLAIRGM
jgi:hypothetical protein